MTSMLIIFHRAGPVTFSSWKSWYHADYHPCCQEWQCFHVTTGGQRRRAQASRNHSQLCLTNPKVQGWRNHSHMYVKEISPKNPRFYTCQNCIFQCQTLSCENSQRQRGWIQPLLKGLSRNYHIDDDYADNYQKLKICWKNDEINFLIVLYMMIDGMKMVMPMNVMMIITSREQPVMLRFVFWWRMETVSVFWWRIEIEYDLSSNLCPNEELGLHILYLQIGIFMKNEDCIYFILKSVS